MYQRLEFGPSDSEDAFLDEAFVREGASEMQIVGGYQIAKLIEVGPKIAIGPEMEYIPDLFAIPGSSAPDCGEARVCTTTVEPSKKEYETSVGVLGLRGS
jgi:hypothetical protein